ncbi:allophanate hydrolase [Actinoplanes sp. CA-252034]|uniref:allophanate hydrolase n=1 Tax=Actinoplanes sp. CA-252034 TaxID=3239906 RepID=UPI003D99337D
MDAHANVDAALAAPAPDGVWISRFSATELHRHADAVNPGLPLAGMTFAVKDNIDVAGLPTTAGCADFAYLPERHAPVVQRLVDAGAIVVGKTNLDQFATGLTGARSPYGAPESVFGGGLISGGSSSGSAVAVANGSVHFALGTDTAGSGRVPAALNGIVGIKPTRGLLSTVGVVPACRSLDCVSIFARELSTAESVMRVARGRVPEDPWSREAPREPKAAPGARQQPGAWPRIGVAEGLDFFGDSGQEKAYARFAGDVTVDVGPLLEAGDLLYRGPWVAERLADLGEFLTARPDSVLPVTRRVLETGLGFSAADAFRARHRLQELRAAADRMWERIDVLVLPTVGTTFTHAEIAEDPIGRNLMLGRYTQFANLLDMAAVTVPNGFTEDGRPASLTLFGPAFSDDRLTALARSLHERERAAASEPEPTTEDRPGAATADGHLLVGRVFEGPGAGGAAMTLAVVGLHLSGEPRNSELVERGGTLLGTARTAPLYRMYELPAGAPGLVRVDDGGAAIEIELWQLPAVTVGGFLAGIPAPLSLGRLLLEDGAEVTGFLCEAYAVSGARDITASGGWRNHRLKGTHS